MAGGSLPASVGSLSNFGRLVEMRLTPNERLSYLKGRKRYTTPVRPGGTTVGLSGGFFHGESALGFSIAHRVSALPSAVVYGSYANSAGAENVYKVGAAYEF
jgi:hypothetical protein